MYALQDSSSTTSLIFTTVGTLDHSILHLNISLSKCANRGRGYQKFNNFLLEDTIFVQKIKSHIQDVIQETYDLSDPRVKWEFLRYKIRFFVRIYEKEKAAFRWARRSYLEEKVKLLENAISSDSRAQVLPRVLFYNEGSNGMRKEENLETILLDSSNTINLNFI